METSDETSRLIEQMQAVTISRQYGSGGGEIAARLASRLHWNLLDHEAVVQVAQQLGISVEDAEQQDEHVESLGMRLLNSLSLIQPPMSNAVRLVPPVYDRAYHETLHKVIEATLDKGHVVIVGRGSQMMLRERRDILHIRIIAPLEQRITYVMQREKLSREDAQIRALYKDGGRERYLQTQYRQDSADPLLYDLVLNTDVLSLDNIVELISTALICKAEQLKRPTGQLGPGAGMTPYSERSQDFSMPVEDLPPEVK